MSAFLKVYTDSGATSEVAHTTDHSFTIAAAAAGDSILTVQSGSLPAGMPTQGTIDIVDGVNGNETIQYYGLTTTTINLGTVLAHLHPAGTTVNQWIYSLAVGDQTNGIPNDGSNSTPVGTNTATWYVKNQGNQTAQSTTLATNNTGATTAEGFTDTLVSITSAVAGFAASVSLGSIAAGAAATQFWVVEEIPNGQTAIHNPNKCVVDLTYDSI